MAHIQNMGMLRDRQQRITLQRVDDHQRRFNIANARRLIYELNYAVDSKSLPDFLKAESWVPTLVRSDSLVYVVAGTWCLSLPQNSFSNRLQPLGFNLFEMLVVDLMHEFELGVWKDLFIHLLRILAAKNPALLHELDRRYACHPCSTIHVYHSL
jgi:hypothetical protein